MIIYHDHLLPSIQFSSLKNNIDRQHTIYNNFMNLQLMQQVEIMLKVFINYVYLILNYQ